MKKINKLASIAILAGIAIATATSAQAITQATSEFVQVARVNAQFQTSQKNYNAARMFCNLIVTYPLNETDPMWPAIQQQQYFGCLSNVQGNSFSGSITIPFTM